MKKSKEQIEKERKEFAEKCEQIKLSLFKKINKTERVIPIDMNLQLYGVLNLESYSGLLSTEFEEWVIADVKRRIYQWLTDHFTEEPYTGEINIINQYTILNIQYEKKKMVIAKHVLKIEDNEIVGFKTMSIEGDDYQED